ncbi:MAG: hypothetical protein QM705_10020 [Ancrocorticia sp.]
MNDDGAAAHCPHASRLFRPTGGSNGSGNPTGGGKQNPGANPPSSNKSQKRAQQLALNNPETLPSQAKRGRN